MSVILLVEDKVDNQLVIEDIFEFDDVGAELVIAESAEDALARIPKLRPILILMDIGLPGICGIEATRRLKADPDTSTIPVWAITAHAMKDAKAEALQAGCDEYVTKPINAPELAARLQAFVESQGSREAA